MKKHYILCLATVASLMTAFDLSAQVTYVKKNATGSNNGSSWQDAYTDLSLALANTSTGQLWVAKGTYLPGGNNPDENDLFAIMSSIALYGGFDGTETSLSQRNPSQNPTILSGDLAGDNAPNSYDSLLSLDNTIHVVYVDSLLASPVVIDGFGIAHGATNNSDLEPGFMWRGGGIYALSPVNVRNCLFTGNYARSGGSVFLAPTCAGSTVRNCIFRNNATAFQSAGIFAEAVAGLTIKQCEFNENKTQRGALYPLRCSNVLVDSCSFSGNVNAGGFGGAMFVWNCVDFTLSNSYFGFNIAANAAAISLNGTELPGIGAENFVIDNCVFEYNESNGFGGGGIWNAGADCSIKDCVFEGNKAQNGAHLFQNAAGAKVIVESCEFNHADASGWGGAMTCYGLNGDFQIKDCTFFDNTANNLGGAANNGFGAIATYEGCTFNGNESASSAGGALALQNDSTTVIAINCVFTSNTSSSNGGAIFSGASESSSIVVVDRCDFSANVAGGVGGAISIGENGDDDISSLILSNSTFGFNQAPVQAGALNLGDTDAEITSCLFYQNIANGTGTGGAISNNVTDSNTVVVNIVNSTFAENIGVLAAGFANWTGTTDAISLTKIQNCIFWHEGGLNYAIEDGTPELTSNGGNLSDDDSMQDYLTHPKDISLGEPTFVNLDDYDYHLTDNSIGIDDGVEAGAPMLDLEGNPRHFLVDMGAYENQTSVGTKEKVLANIGLLSLSPNPAMAATTNLVLENEWQGELRIRVTNVIGETVWAAAAQKAGKQLQYALPLPFGRGVYQVQVSNGSQMVTERLVRL
jgi:hypothetical protein